MFLIVYLLCDWMSCIHVVNVILLGVSNFIMGCQLCWHNFRTIDTVYSELTFGNNARIIGDIF